jgi:hypothetical protein
LRRIPDLSTFLRQLDADPEHHQSTTEARQESPMKLSHQGANIMFKAALRNLRSSSGKCLVALSICLAAGRAVAIDLQPNFVMEPVQSFSGTVDSIPIPPSLVGGEEGVTTGPITLSLDPTADNVFGLDNVFQQGQIDVTLMLSSKLFTELDQTPEIHIMESGPASICPVEGDWPGFDFFFQASLTGGGTVANGLFEGTTFHNLNIYDGDGVLGSWIVLPGSTVTWNIGTNGSVTFPDGTVVNNIGGSGQLTIAAEPSGSALAFLAAICGLGTFYRVRRARGRSIRR